MRISSGKYKGRNLIAPKGYNVRPTSSKVKEAIFGKIQFDIYKASFLDLFAGVGTMGIEALSRGAREVIFSDISYESIKTIKQNLQIIGEKAKVINNDYSTTLKLLNGSEFDFIFIDPPYRMDCIEIIQKLTQEYNVLGINGMLIYEHKSEKVLNIYKSSYIIVDTKVYGNTSISYLKRIK